MTKKKKAAKKRNPQDATRRNVQAAGKRSGELAYTVETLRKDYAVEALRKDFEKHVAWVGRTFAANAIIPAAS